MITGDYHTHTKASDGRQSAAEMFAAAREIGLKELAVTDHSLTSLIFHVTEQKLSAQRAEIDRLNAEGGVKLYQGVEANIMSDGSLDVPDGVIRKLDMLLCGFHRLLEPHTARGQGAFIFVNGFAAFNEREKMRISNTDVYLKALYDYPIDVICHLNHRFLVDTKEICSAAARTGAYIELNEKHIDALERDMEIAVQSGVNFILGSDAHKADTAGRFDKVKTVIAKYGIPRDRVFGLDKPAVFKDKRNFAK